MSLIMTDLPLEPAWVRIMSCKISEYVMSFALDAAHCSGEYRFERRSGPSRFSKSESMNLNAHKTMA